MKRNSNTSCQSPAESVNTSADTQACGEASPDAVSTNSEGTQENRDDLVPAQGSVGRKAACPLCFMQACLRSSIYTMATHVLYGLRVASAVDSSFRLAIPVLFSWSLFCLYWRKEGSVLCIFSVSAPIYILTDILVIFCVNFLKLVSSEGIQSSQ